MNWIFNRREITKPAFTRLKFEGTYEKWKHLAESIEYLIIVNDVFIVFIDKELDVDWSLRDDRPGEPDPTHEVGLNTALNRAAVLETTPCDEIRPRMKLHFKRLIGEGIARALAKDYADAQKILDLAQGYITARSEETSRYWYLSASALMTLPFVGLACSFWLARGWLQAEVGDTAFWEILSACAGATGALLSVIGRTGKQHFDCSAGRRLHFLEAASRIWAGAISGILVGLAVHSEIFLTAITHNGNMPAIMMIAALGSGVSERLAVSIIADLGPKGPKPTKG